MSRRQLDQRVNRDSEDSQRGFRFERWSNIISSLGMVLIGGYVAFSIQNPYSDLQALDLESRMTTPQFNVDIGAEKVLTGFSVREVRRWRPINVTTNVDNIYGLEADFLIHVQYCDQQGRMVSMETINVVEDFLSLNALPQYPAVSELAGPIAITYPLGFEHRIDDFRRTGKFRLGHGESNFQISLGVRSDIREGNIALVMANATLPELARQRIGKVRKSIPGISENEPKPISRGPSVPFRTVDLDNSAPALCSKTPDSEGI